MKILTFILLLSTIQICKKILIIFITCKKGTCIIQRSIPPQINKNKRHQLFISSLREGITFQGMVY